MLDEYQSSNVIQNLLYPSFLALIRMSERGQLRFLTTSLLLLASRVYLNSFHECMAIETLAQD